MQRIPSELTVMYKRGMQWTLVAFGIAFPPVFTILESVEDTISRVMLFVVLPLVRICSGYLVIRSYSRNLADEVRDCEETLLIRNGDREFHIALTDCLNVSCSTYANPVCNNHPAA